MLSPLPEKVITCLASVLQALYKTSSLPPLTACQQPYSPPYNDCPITCLVTGLKIKLDDKAARKSFAARHKCDQKTDKTKPGYWACNMPRYAKQLGLSGGGNFFW